MDEVAEQEITAEVTEQPKATTVEEATETDEQEKES